MSCPIWRLPEFDREHWDLDYLCGLMDCPECTAEPGDIPWIPYDADLTAGGEPRES